MRFMQRNGGCHFFAQCGMSAAEGDCGRDRGMPKQYLVNFMGRDIFSPSNNDVLDSSSQVQIAIFVEHPLIAGAKPSVYDAARVSFGIILIAAKDACALNRDFPTLIGPEMMALIVHNADANAGAHPDRTCFAMAWGQRIGRHLVSSLCHSIGFNEWHAKNLLDPMNQLRRQR